MNKGKMEKKTKLGVLVLDVLRLQEEKKPLALKEKHPSAYKCVVEWKSESFSFRFSLV